MNRPFIFAVLVASPALAQPWFGGAPDLLGGTFLARARAISGDGHVIVGMSNSTNGDEAMRWVLAAPGAGGLSDIPGGTFSSEAFACSFDGNVAFGRGTNAAGNSEAFRWTPAGGMVSLGFLPTGGYTSTAYGCSANGLTACGENLVQLSGSPPPLPVTEAFRWTQSGGMVGLGFLPGGAHFLSTARAMSSDGNAICGWATDAALGNRPFYWTQATGMIDISAGAFNGLARGISPNGQWVAGSNSVNSHAFIWSQATGVTDLGTLPGAPTSIGVKVTSDGRRVLGQSNSVACLWQQGTGWSTVASLLAAQGVSTTGWTLTVPQGMSDDGATITGYGTNPSGQTQAWVAMIPMPPPPCGTADFDGDGDAGTDFDIQAFFACLGGDCCALCFPGGSDFNGDGDSGTDADIESFFRVLGGGPC